MEQGGEVVVNMDGGGDAAWRPLLPTDATPQGQGPQQQQHQQQQQQQQQQQEQANNGTHLDFAEVIRMVQQFHRNAERLPRQAPPAPSSGVSRPLLEIFRRTGHYPSDGSALTQAVCPGPEGCGVII